MQRDHTETLSNYKDIQKDYRDANGIWENTKRQQRDAKYFNYNDVQLQRCKITIGTDKTTTNRDVTTAKMSKGRNKKML